MVDRSILQERLLKAYNLLLDRGLVHNKQQFADEIGVQRPALYNALNNNGRVLTKGLLTKVADAFPDVLNKDYLLNGVGEVAKPIGKPHIPFEVAAGGVAVALGSATLSDCDIRPTLPTFGDYDFTIEVSGKSMQPYILHGDTLICKNVGLNTVIIRPKHCYVIDTPEGAVVKHISVEGDFIVCKSLNPEFKTFKMPIHDDMRFAMVVGIIRHCD
ncbi:MAG: S24 family peptidase [Candidatus Limisoma sp.]|nr:S24 family peptidase [Candidatus Limisoma sp.]